MSDDLTQLPVLTHSTITEHLEQRYKNDKIYTGLSNIIVSVNPHKPVLDDAAIQKLTHRICRSNTPQSVVCSGESGAGKTESAKRIIKGINAGSLSELLDATNPILEAFGNAQTTRNHNSSRFAKFIKIYKPNAVGAGGSASIQTYLLETSRVSHTPGNECNYHVFYALSPAASRLAPNTPHKVPSKTVISSCFTKLGLTPEQVHDVFAVVEGILYLGGLCPDDLTTNNVNPYIQSASVSWGIPPVDLIDSITNRKIKIGNETIIKRVTHKESESTRDSIVRIVYSSLFNWIVSRINQAMGPHGEIQSSHSNPSNWIGILDIFGFESFQHNSFEQFCINYANEKLQDLFNRIILVSEQEVYAREGIRWTPVEIHSNREVVDTFDGRTSGIFSLLDSACLLKHDNQEKSSEAFVDTIIAQHVSGVKQPQVIVARHPKGTFTIKHYAGDIRYTATEFIRKNDDSLPHYVADMLKVCSNSVLREACLPIETNTNRRFKSIGRSFCNQLQTLVHDIEQSTVHFIKCINPNTQQKPGLFDTEYVQHQILCGGLLEAVKVLKLGYPYRTSCELIVNKFIHQGFTLSPRRIRHLCEAVVECVVGSVPGANVVVGVTKVFFKENGYEIVQQIEKASENVTADMRARIKASLVARNMRTLRGVAKTSARLQIRLRRLRAIEVFARTVRVVAYIAKWIKRAKPKAIKPEAIKPEAIKPEAIKPDAEAATQPLFIHEMTMRLDTLTEQLDTVRRCAANASAIRVDMTESPDWNPDLARAAAERERELLMWQQQATVTLGIYERTIQEYKMDRMATEQTVAQTTHEYRRIFESMRLECAKHREDDKKENDSLKMTILALRRQVSQYEAMVKNTRSHGRTSRSIVDNV